MKKIYLYAAIILIAVISIFPLLQKSNIYGHDSRFHVACINDIKENISFSTPIPKINSNIGNNLGYGTNLFYPPLPHYLCAYLHLTLENFGIKLSTTIALVYLLITIASGIVMFHLSFSITKKENVSLLSSVIFLLMPYRIGNIIVRAALNESFVFLFFPMILLALHRLIENKKFLLLFIIGYTGLILSHLVLAFYSSIFIIFWGLFHLKNLFKKDIIKKLLVGILIVSILVLPSISLMLSQKANGNYLVFIDGYMTGFSFLSENFCYLSDFITQKADYSWDMPLFINLLVLISLFFSFIYFIIHTQNTNMNIFYLIFLLILCFSMCLKIFPWKILPNIFYTIQFPWRLQIFISICISILSPFWISNFKFEKITSIIFIITLLISELSFFKSLSTYKYLYDGINYNSGLGNYQEYFSVNTYYFMDYFVERDTNIHIDNISTFNAKIFESSDKIIFKIENIKGNAIIELPRLYYIGYKLTNSKNENINFYENQKGFIEFIGISDTYTLEYKGPIIYQIFIIIRNIFILLLISFYSYKFFKHKKLLYT